MNRLREGLGGSFTFCTLGDPIEIEGMLTGRGLYPTFRNSGSLFAAHSDSGVSAGRGRSLKRKDDDGLFYTTDTNNYYLLYEPDIDYLCSNEAMLNEERAKRIGAATREQGRKGYSIRCRQVHRPTGAHHVGASRFANCLTSCIRTELRGGSGRALHFPLKRTGVQTELRYGIKGLPISRFGSLQPLARSPWQGSARTPITAIEALGTGGC